ncbi:phage tail protein [Burkholderia sp. ABCPW 14]|uniref:phage tail protein n=1 Tax=Burkholderia sp. ABCPW 14 TaxID=1637860 RepID=UPI000770D364|nr:phage tail protein [Burkholderia sp. ABCPW 14]KVD76982.1 phage tail protein [Burkholderia sp. ABCPW 14]
MANLKEQVQWDDGIYQLETSDPVMGGPDGVDNLQAKQLANRTRFLKGEIERQGGDKVSKAGDAMRGALLGKVGAGTASNAGFGFDGDPDTGLFSPRAGVVQVTLKGVPAAEWSVDAAGLRKVRTTISASFDNGVSAGLDRGDGGQLRAVGKDYGAFLRNDDTSVYLMSTKKGDPLGSWSDWRPLSWSLETGKVSVDGNGAGATFGGAVDVAGDLTVAKTAGEGHLRLGPLDGYFYTSKYGVGWWSPTIGSFQYVIEDRTFRIDGKPVWHQGNLTPLDLNKGGTLKGDLTCEPGTRIVLSEGSVGSPSLTFGNDGAPDTGLFHIADGHFGVASNAVQIVHFAPDGTYFDRPAFGVHPPGGDRSNRYATTQWVADAISTTAVGQIVFEMRTSVRAGYLKCNGAVLKRADYPALWAYAQGSGALVAEKDWSAGNWGCYSDGDGATTFRIPELRGEFMRCWDDGRGVNADRRIGTAEGDQNRSHAHGASASRVDDHSHSAWTDSQGQHNHHVNDPGHLHGVVIDYWTGGGGAKGYLGGGGDAHGTFQWNTGGSGTGIWLGEAGVHGHNVGIGGAGAHDHVISVAADGGNESRPRNVAVMAMLRAY